MNSISRRAVLSGAIATAGTFVAPASANTIETTYIYAPHPDDETLYLSGYITFAAARGDRLILVAVTDGGATKARPAGWTIDELMAIRRIEQESAWRALTGGRGEVIRLGLIDGSRSAMTNPVRDFARQHDGPGIEHYAACNDNQSMDHTAVTQGLRRSGVRISRYANPPGSKVGFRYAPVDLAACNKAHSSFVAVGQRSVPQSFEVLKASGFTSRITK